MLHWIMMHSCSCKTNTPLPCPPVSLYFPLTTSLSHFPLPRTLAHSAFNASHTPTPTHKHKHIHTHNHLLPVWVNEIANARQQFSLESISADVMSSIWLHIKLWFNVWLGLVVIIVTTDGIWTGKTEVAIYMTYVFLFSVMDCCHECVGSSEYSIYTVVCLKAFGGLLLSFLIMWN